MITARSQYDARPVLASDLSCEGDKGVTKQADLKDCDLNAIFKKYERCGQLPDMIARDGHFGDFSDVPTYQEALEITRHAQEQFDNLDVTIRNRFANDPAKFLEFATDANNIEELDRMGLLNADASARLKAQREVKDAAIAKKVEADKALSEKELIAKVKAELNK